MVQFIPNQPKALFTEVPYFEDSSKTGVSGSRTRKSIEVLQMEVATALMKLGATGAYFVDGTFDTKPKRYGYNIHFAVQGIPARMSIAALPLRSETPNKKKDSLEQALYLFRDHLIAQYHAAIYQPGYMPLMPYLVGEGGQTVYEAFMESQILPMLTGGK